MSIFGSIVSAIFHHSAHAAPAPGGSAAKPAAPGSGAAAGAPAAQVAKPTATPPLASSAAPSSAPKETVDVAAIMDKLAGRSKEKLDWRHSIVDLIKLLDLDSSLAARKTLAGELHYTGNTDDSATMNVWLHKQVMTKLAENGGRVPDELKH
jgi:Domain of unknown function (DUF3597)